MNEITAITPQIKDKTRCNIYIDGRFCCGLTLEAVIKNRLKTGQTVTPERLAQIQLESEKNTALDKALTHVSATRKTEKQVRDFLTKKGYLPVVIEFVLEKMRGYGFLDDGEYAEAYVEFASRKKGGRLIRMELKAKGVSDEEIDGALEGLDGDTQETAAKTLLQKYMRGKEPTRENLQKAYRYLTGKGFDYETAKNALSTLGDIEED
ncbi:MAG: RecX family transcriptional regulator [Clostridia bacterium]|nr:RecX family transcriptional regulator [Clostridia bacterium]